MSGSGAHSHYLWLSLWCGFPSQPLLAVDFMGKDLEQLILSCLQEKENLQGLHKSEESYQLAKCF